MSKKVYIIGSLRNEKVPTVANALREEGYEVWDDWYAAGPEADDYWQKYEKGRGHSYKDCPEHAHAPQTPDPTDR